MLYIAASFSNPVSADSASTEMPASDASRAHAASVGAKMVTCKFGWSSCADRPASVSAFRVMVRLLAGLLRIWPTV